LVRRLFIAVVALVGLAGCSVQRPWGQDGRRAHELPDQTLTDESHYSRYSQSADRNRPDRVVRIRFDILRVDLPMDAVRHSKKIWNHIDELRPDSRLVATLARNGIRVGAAPESVWPALQTIFDSARARPSEYHQVVQGGIPFSIELGAMPEQETIFCYDRSGRLAGKPIPAGEKLLHLDYLLHPELDGCTDVSLVFEVRRDLGTMVWENRNGVIRQVPAYDHFRFEDLSVLLTLRPGEFLVIGPGDEADNDYLVGSRFFSAKRSGVPFESVICITPRPFAVETDQHLTSQTVMP